MYCNLDDNCIYHVFYGGNCYLGDCSVTTQTLPDQGYGSVVYKAGLSEASVCQDRFPENNDYQNVWTTFVFESLDPGTTGEPECAIRCMLHPYNKCHFYAFINGRCYF